MKSANANCSLCRNARAMKTMPYCSVPRDGALVLLVEILGGWKTQSVLPGVIIPEARA